MRHLWTPLLLSLSLGTVAPESSSSITGITCPEKCRCLERGGGIQESRVDCAGRNVTQVPLPIDDLRYSALLLHDNKISQVDMSFLRHFPDLRTLNLARNSIRSLIRSGDDDESNSSIFRPSFALERIDLSGNHLHVLHNGVLGGGAFPSLRYLNLSCNAIHTVAPAALALPALQTLDLSGNALEEVDRRLFETSPRLNEVDLSANRLSRLDDGTLGTLTRLALLDLSNNQIMRLESGVLAGLNVSHLDLSDNALRRVPTLALARMTKAKTLLLDGNHFQTLETGSLRGIPAEFVSISRCPFLLRVEDGAVEASDTLRALTVNENSKLSYVSPNLAMRVDRLAALDLSKNALYALESSLPEGLPSLRALYLGGNRFHCHCSLAWIARLANGEGGSVLRLEDKDRVFCRTDDDHDEPVGDSGERPFDDDYDPDALMPAAQMAASFASAPECEPYILPLFPSFDSTAMGHNVTWLCKALGSRHMSLSWRLPPSPSAVASGSVTISAGECLERACVSSGSALTVRFLHPGDAGKYACVAKNKFGQDQRQVVLAVKSENIQIFPITVASTFVTLSWNTSSSSLSTGRGYVLQVRKKGVEHGEFERDAVIGRISHTDPEIIKQYEDIDVGLKMTSYTVNGLRPGVTYLFTLCLRRGSYVIALSSAALTTREPDFQAGLGIETDYASLFAVAVVLTALATSCVGAGVVRACRYRAFAAKQRLNCAAAAAVAASASGHSRRGGGCMCGGGGSDTQSQREMIVATSPSERSSSVNSYSCQGSSSSCHRQHQRHYHPHYHPYFQHQEQHEAYRHHHYRQLHQQPKRKGNNSNNRRQQQQQHQAGKVASGLAEERSVLVEHEVMSPMEEEHDAQSAAAAAAAALSSSTSSSLSTSAAGTTSAQAKSTEMT